MAFTRSLTLPERPSLPLVAAREARPCRSRVDALPPVTSLGSRRRRREVVRFVFWESWSWLMARPMLAIVLDEIAVREAQLMDVFLGVFFALRVQPDEVLPGRRRSPRGNGSPAPADAGSAAEPTDLRAAQRVSRCAGDQPLLPVDRGSREPRGGVRLRGGSFCPRRSGDEGTDGLLRQPPSA
jgi:hypothetical protein